MNHKAQSVAIIGGNSFIVITIIIVFVISYIVSNSSSEEEINKNTLNLYLKNIDSETKDVILNSNYMISINDTEYLSGKMKSNSWTDLSVPIENIEVSCYSEEYYYSKTKKTFTQVEINDKQSNFKCEMDRIGDLKIDKTGKFDNQYSQIKINLSTDKTFNNVGAVISWSPGVIEAYFEGRDAIICEDSTWLNYDYIDYMTNDYHYLPEGYYRCGNCLNGVCDKLEKCKSVNAKECVLEPRNIPERFFNKVDGIKYFGVDLKENILETTLLIKGTENLNKLDFVEITFFDYDTRYDKFTNTLVSISEQDNKNIGNPNDYKLRLDYE